MSSDITKISIGLPVYNGDRFLPKKLESILNQTHKDFELIISDNASTDKTEIICKKYAQLDKRIQYYRHATNNGAAWNFNFVLRKATCSYFMWTAVDDIILPNFIEKIIKTFETNKKCVACICKIAPYEPDDDEIYFDKSEIKHLTRIKKIRNRVRPRYVFPIVGSFESKARVYLKNCSCQVIYSIFKTDVLQKSTIQDSFLGNDWAIFLNVLQAGDLAVYDDILMYEYERGASGRSIISIAKQFNKNKTGTVFPWYPLTNWCLRRFGFGFFLKNIDYFVQLNVEGFFSLVMDSFQSLIRIKKTSKKNESDLL